MVEKVTNYARVLKLHVYESIGGDIREQRICASCAYKN